MENLGRIEATHKQIKKMESNFIGQGLIHTKKPVGEILIESFPDAGFNEFLCLAAFASESGVAGLSEHILKAKEHLNFRILVGIDQKGTSKEALEALLKLDINTGIFHSRSHIIFHPKIYIFEGKEKCRIIVGSCNLTTPGLFQNIEASILLNFNKPDKEGEQVLSQIKDYFKSFIEGEDQNVQELSDELIATLSSSGLIPSETERRRIQEKGEALEKENSSEEMINKLKEMFPTIAVQPAPRRFKPHTVKKQVGSKKLVISNEPLAVGELLWHNPKLPPSSIQYATDGTNPTGGLRLTQAGWKDENGTVIDQTTYFRNVVFGSLNWQAVSDKVEAAEALFHVEIKGVDKGFHTLTIRHKPSGEAGQRNYTTSISWGAIGDIIQEAQLKDHELNLYAPEEGSEEPFFIEIP